ncbi:hypothetical protein [Micromonospora peucetia]|uniref:Secreted protein n=1 Tax=Micromonospora peucetia TaxID=47871 RepID=A0ABZ1ED57_9ACTN|nr:hypothetical protein [Micromonospora peucetia]WSA31578.1 hypothetical protein OIE14_26165 [Micromonospora peucetia]
MSCTSIRREVPRPLLLILIEPVTGIAVTLLFVDGADDDARAPQARLRVCPLLASDPEQDPLARADQTSSVVRDHRPTGDRLSTVRKKADQVPDLGVAFDQPGTQIIGGNGGSGRAASGCGRSRLRFICGILGEEPAYLVPPDAEVVAGAVEGPTASHSVEAAGGLSWFTVRSLLDDQSGDHPSVLRVFALRRLFEDVRHWSAVVRNLKVLLSQQFAELPIGDQGIFLVT